MKKDCREILFEDNPEVLKKAKMILTNESNIDPEEELIGITWTPDPKEHPDADFRVQHELHVSMLADYLKCCACGLFCVESTTLGNPHYHGWFQIDPKLELARVAIIKAMQRFGRVTPEVLKHYRINSYTKGNNSLWYYKKDVFDQMLAIDINPIDKNSFSTIDFDQCRLISLLTRPSAKNCVPTSAREKWAKMANSKLYYGDTLSYINFNDN